MDKWRCYRTEPCPDDDTEMPRSSTICSSLSRWSDNNRRICCAIFLLKSASHVAVMITYTIIDVLSIHKKDLTRLGAQVFCRNFISRIPDLAWRIDSTF
ncbi:hypothetical protein Plhal304r1_c054g0138571 [Plasmopara halstedii]